MVQLILFRLGGNSTYMEYAIFWIFILACTDVCDPTLSCTIIKGSTDTLSVIYCQNLWEMQVFISHLAFILLLDSAFEAEVSNDQSSAVMLAFPNPCCIPFCFCCHLETKSIENSGPVHETWVCVCLSVHVYRDPSALAKKSIHAWACWIEIIFPNGEFPSSSLSLQFQL